MKVEKGKDKLMKKISKINKIEMDINDKTQVGLVLFVLIFSCFIFEYSDCKAYTQWSINIWDALAKGRINDYFLVTAENARHAYYAGNSYGILYLIPWAIWNFPIWITHYFGGNLNIDTPLCFFWAQLFLLLCAIIMAVYSAKITFHVTKQLNLAKNAFILILGAGSLMISIGYSGQDEIVYMAVFMMGIYYFISEKKGIGKLFLFISVVFCNMMIIPVLAFLLNYEKNVIKIGLFSVCTFVPEKILSYLCGSSKIDEIINSGKYPMGAKYTLDTYAGWFFENNILNLGIGAVSLFIVITIMVLLKAYFNNETEERKIFLSLFYPTVIMTLVLCIVAWEHAYRYFICVPLIVITVLISGFYKKDVGAGIFLLLVFEGIRTIIACENDYILGFGACSLSTWSSSHMQTGTLYTFISQKLPIVEKLRIPFNSIFLAVAICVLAYMCYENRKQITIAFPEKIIKYSYCLISLCLICVFLIVYFKYDNKVYDINGDDQLAIAINGENSIYQKYIPDGKRLDFIEIRSVTWNREYPDNLYFAIDLLDENNSVVSSKNIPASSLKNNDNVKIDFNIKLNKGETYYFHFYSPKIIEEKDNWMYLLRSNDEVTVSNGLEAKLEQKGIVSNDEVPYNVINYIEEKK